MSIQEQIYEDNTLHSVSQFTSNVCTENFSRIYTKLAENVSELAEDEML